MSASFYDLLKYAHTGNASAEMTAYDKMRAVAMGGATKTLTGVPPLTFKANGKPLISWSMLGNGQQNGTPSPDNIIMPDLCGERTGNLFDADTAYGTYKQSDGTYKALIGKFYTTYIKPFTSNDIGKNYTFYVYIVSMDSSIRNVRVMANVNGTNIDGNFLSAAGATKVSFTVETIDDYLYFGYGQGVNDITVKDIMLNSGSTALPYEPYGWAEKITCAGQTTPVYLGEVPTVRRIRKLVLTGDEFWLLRNGDYYSDVADRDSLQNMPCICTHTAGGILIDNGSIRLKVLASQFTAVASNRAEWISYLAQQYQNGTPVTVWYVLARREIRIVNEPLAKIGDYADELSSADAGVSIPTIKGQNTLTIDTDLKPSSMTITYRE